MNILKSARGGVKIPVKAAVIPTNFAIGIESSQTANTITNPKRGPKITFWVRDGPPGPITQVYIYSQNTPNPLDPIPIWGPYVKQFMS